MHVEVLRNPPISGSVSEHYYDAYGACTFVRFESEVDEAWVGVFGNGSVTTHSNAIPYSNGSNVFVIAGGQGYIVDANTKLLIHKTKNDYFVSGIAVPSRDFVIVSDFTDLYAFSAQDILWRSDRVAADGIDLQNSSISELRGRVWNLDWYDFTLHYDDWKFQQGSMSMKQD